MNSLNSFFVDAGVGIAITRAEREKKVRKDAFEVGRAGANILEVGVTLKPKNARVVVFFSKGIELLE